MKILTADELLYNQKKETYGMAAFEGSIYVLWGLPHLDYNDGHAYYANAFRIGDEILEDRSAPYYRVVWKNPYPPEGMKIRSHLFKTYPWDKMNASLNALIKSRNFLFKLCYKKFISKEPGDYEEFLYGQIAKRKPSQVLPNGWMWPYDFNSGKYSE